MIISSVDVGSNAIRQVIIEILNPELSFERWKILKKYRLPLRLGSDVFESKKLKPETISKMIACFTTIAQLNTQYKVTKKFITATSALRDCQNQKNVIAKIKKETGLKISVISGHQEAQFIRNAILKTNLTQFRNVLMIDIGGGSLELSALKSNALICSESYPLGVVRLLKGKVQTSYQLQKVVKENMSEFKKKTQKINFDFALGTGGNFDALSKLKLQLLHSSPDTNLSILDIKKIFIIWKTLTLSQKMSLDVRKDRIDVLDIALPLIIQTMGFFNLKHIKIPHTGLKEGVILSRIR